MAWLGNWSKRIKITIDKDQVDSTLSDFPASIYLSASSGQNNDDVSVIFDELITVSGTKKIAVTTSDEETQCYVEIERWDWDNEKAWLHVKVPTITSGTDTNLYLYYDSTQADNTTYVGDVGSTPAQNVWDSNFKAVYHLGEDPTGGSGCIKDSTSNANNGTPGGSMTSGDLVDGHFGKALDFDGSNDYIHCGTGFLNSPGDGYTIEACVFVHNFTDWLRVVDKGPDSNNQLGLLGDATAKFNLAERVSGAWYPTSMVDTCNTNQWYYLAGKGDGVDIDAYLDGVWKSTSTSYIGSTSGPFYIATFIGAATPYLDGLIDEVRVSNTDRSSAWIKATYYSNWDNLITFSESYRLAFTCSGTVQVDSIFTDGIDVRLYRRNNGQLVGETTTISGGLFEIDSYYDEDHYIVALYTTSGTNALVYDYIHP